MNSNHKLLFWPYGEEEAKKSARFFFRLNPFNTFTVSAVMGSALLMPRLLPAATTTSIPANSSAPSVSTQPASSEQTPSVVTFNMDGHDYTLSSPQNGEYRFHVVGETAPNDKEPEIISGKYSKTAVTVNMTIPSTDVNTPPTLVQYKSSKNGSASITKILTAANTETLIDTDENGHIIGRHVVIDGKYDVDGTTGIAPSALLEVKDLVGRIVNPETHKKPKKPHSHRFFEAVGQAAGHFVAIPYNLILMPMRKPKPLPTRPEIETQVENTTVTMHLDADVVADAVNHIMLGTSLHRRKLLPSYVPVESVALEATLEESQPDTLPLSARNFSRLHIVANQLPRAPHNFAAPIVSASAPSLAAPMQKTVGANAGLSAPENPGSKSGFPPDLGGVLLPFSIASLAALDAMRRRRQAAENQRVEIPAPASSNALVAAPHFGAVLTRQPIFAGAFADPTHPTPWTRIADLSLKAKKRAPAFLRDFAMGAGAGALAKTTLMMGVHFAVAGAALTAPAAIGVAMGAGAVAGAVSRVAVTAYKIHKGEQEAKKHWLLKAAWQGAAIGLVGGSVGSHVAQLLHADQLVHNIAQFLHVDKLTQSVFHTHAVAPAATHPVSQPLPQGHAIATNPVAHAAPQDVGAAQHVNAVPDLMTDAPKSFLTADQIKSLPIDLQHLAGSHDAKDWVNFCQAMSGEALKHPTAAQHALGGNASDWIKRGLDIANNHGVHGHIVKQLNANEAFGEAYGKLGFTQNLSDAAEHAKLAGKVMNNWAGRYLASLKQAVTPSPV